MFSSSSGHRPQTGLSGHGPTMSRRLFQRSALPAVLGTSQLVTRPIALVELQRDDINGTVPRGSTHPDRTAILSSRDCFNEGVQIRGRLSVDFRNAPSCPQLITCCRRAV